MIVFPKNRDVCRGKQGFELQALVSIGKALGRTRRRHAALEGMKGVTS